MIEGKVEQLLFIMTFEIAGLLRKTTLLGIHSINKSWNNLRSEEKPLKSNLKNCQNVLDILFPEGTSLATPEMTFTFFMPLIKKFNSIGMMNSFQLQRCKQNSNPAVNLKFISKTLLPCQFPKGSLEAARQDKHTL